MANSQMSEVLQHLRRAVLLRDAAGLTDGQLLEDYISRREEAALAAVVRRHGPMVWGVCRRVLQNPHDAEDAFQATFLVLVRKAASVVPREMVANWLYGVARTTALRANAVAAKRRLRERQVRNMPEPEAVQSDLWEHLQPLLDQGLSRLPAKYRVAIVLCDLEGKSHKEAARQLGWPQGTLSGRLSRARKMLASRLARDGLAVSAGTLAGVLSQNPASACVPTSLVSSTVKAASLLAAGHAAVAGLVTVQAAALTEGVVMTMLLSKFKTVTMVLLIAALVGGTGLFYRIQAAPPANAAPGAAGSPTGEDEPDRDKNAEPGSSEQSGRSLLSSSPMPWQALVSLKKDLLVVRTSSVHYDPTTVV